MNDDKLKLSTTTNGTKAEPGLENSPAPGPINPDTKQHTNYWVLKPEEIAKGLVRPVRKMYVHKVCSAVTSMSLEIAQTYARDPKYYGSTFCIYCKDHFPVSEFYWAGTNNALNKMEDVGS